MEIVYFTSKTGNTARFVKKLKIAATEISKGLIINKPFVLFVPTYAAMDGKGSVPTPMIKFLNELSNRSKLQAIVGFGNRSFGKNFAIGSEVISLKCKVPILHKVELFGTSEDVEIVQHRIKEYE